MLREITPAEKNSHYPLSAAQQRIFVLHELDQGSTLYNIPSMQEIDYQTDHSQLNAIFQVLVDRHESLRTNIVTVDDTPRQVIQEQINFKADYIESDNNSPNQAFQSFIKPFNLKDDVLIRVAQLRLTKAKKCFLFIDMHHIISDGASFQILEAELLSLAQGKPLAPIKLQFKDFAVFEQSMTQSGVEHPDRSYWLDKFADGVPSLDLPTDYPRPAIQSFAGMEHSQQLGQSVTMALRELSHQNKATMNMTVMALFLVLLHKYSGKNNLVIGTPVAGRSNPQVQPIIGMFVNTLALRVKVEQKATFASFLALVKQELIQAMKHQNYAFDQLVDEVGIPRNPARNPIFDVMFSYENATFGAADERNVSSDFTPGNAKFDLTATFTELQNDVICNLEFCVDLFDNQRIGNIQRSFAHVIKQVINNPGIDISAIQLNDEAAKKKLKSQSIGRSLVLPKGLPATLDGIIEQHAAQHPDHLCLLGGSAPLSYIETNQRANRVANYLLQAGVLPEDRVIIMMDRSPNMVLAIIGTLKSGACYVPVDPDYPAERIRHMVEDSQAKFIITDRENFSFGEVTNSLKSIPYPDIEASMVPSENPSVAKQPNNLAYIIYTSGSTGLPKGVSITHSALRDFPFALGKHFTFEEDERFLLLASICFDASVMQMSLALGHGYPLLILQKNDILDLDRFEAMLNEYAITHVDGVPSFLRQLNLDRLPYVKRIVSGGEACPPELVRRFTKKVDVYNLYGPTEVTVVSTVQHYPKGSTVDRVTIGTPMTSRHTYVLNESLQPCPIGVPGELYVGGKGLAREYFRRPDLTTKNFITESPFGTKERLYSTGDRVQWTRDGQIEYLERIDEQVKLRGYRVELMEIEAQLQQCPEVESAAVILHENSLVGFFTAKKDSVDHAVLKSYLEARLIDYMVPTMFSQVDSIPLMPNGKKDKTQLTKLAQSLESNDQPLVAPQNQLQHQILKIWQSVLGTSKFGIDDDFFQVGGHSLKATRVLSKIRKELDLPITLESIFQYTTIRKLANKLQQAQKTTPLEPIHPLLEVTEGKENVFMIHDVSGQTQAYLGLAKALDSFNWYGIRFDLGSKVAPQNISLESLARNYVKLIRSRQPIGPYLLGGWSLGGVVALEVARILENEGDEVEHIFVFDSHFASKEDSKRPPFDIQTELALIKELGIEMDIALPTSDDIDSLWEGVIQQLEKLTLSSILSFIPEQFRDFLSNQDSVWDIIQNVNAMRTLECGLRNHEPQAVLSGQLHYYQAEDNNENLQAWVACFDEMIEIHEVSGNHFTLFQKDGLEDITESFQELLQEKNNSIATI